MRAEISVRVYYEDTDLAGVVYYANYLRYIERGRTEMLRDVGVEQTALKREHGLVFVVRSLSAEYLAPARFDDLLRVRTEVEQLGGASLTMRQQVLKTAGDAEPAALFEARVRLACMGEDGRPQRLPAALRALMG